ncbi:MAG: hypothetical protein NTX26_03165 [Candidatus Parcubacteria bacterium]|nr:hypothetical protein [Candidatus Parcubacteria bacterium]
MLKKGIVFLVIVSFFALATKIALAGFGISPPYITNDNLAKGSVYEKKITIVRGDPLEDLKAVITINVPGASEWISIDKGNEFILPKGEQQVPIIIRIQVPQNADYGSHRGNIRIKTSSVAPIKEGAVTISLGAQIDVNLNVSKTKIFDFIVRSVSPKDTEEGYKKFGFYFPTKISFALRLENLGNIKARPTKIILDIYDSSKTYLLETVEAKDMGSVKPFENNIISADFLTKLPAGSYYGHFRIYKNDEIAQGGEGEVHLSVVSKGSIPNYQGANIFDLSTKEQIIILSAIILLFTVVFFVVFKIVRRRKV